MPDENFAGKRYELIMDLQDRGVSSSHSHCSKDCVYHAKINGQGSQCNFPLVVSLRDYPDVISVVSGHECPFYDSSIN